MRAAALLGFVIVAAVSSPATARRKSPPPRPSQTATSSPVDGLTLSATIEPTMFVVSLTLTNRGKTPLDVLSYVHTHESQYDWFELELWWPERDSSGACTVRKHLVVALTDARDKSSPVTASLRPGKSVVHAIDVPAWVRRKINGSVTLGGGNYKLVARYRVTGAAKSVWQGVLETPPIRTVALDQQRIAACTPTNWDTW